MGLLSKLFGGDQDAEKVAKDLLNGILGNAAASDNGEQAPRDEYPDNTADSQPVRDEIPAEENQYNYNGTYEQYFEHVFALDFPECRYEKSYIDDYGKHRVIYTFYNGTARALVIELMPESCSAVKFRNDCIRAGVPYLRFYYDHDGWWNTRSYVAGRMRGSLNG